MAQINNRKYKIALLAIKYIPVIIFLIMLIHTGLLIFNINDPFADTTAGSAIIPSLLILSISSLFKFYALHKSLTIYSLLVDLCINFQRYIGFGVYIIYFRIIVFIIGLILLIILIIKFKKYHNTCCNLH